MTSGNHDQWANDPQVQSLRVVFQAMEEAHYVLLGELGLSPLDARLGSARARAKTLFAMAWSQALAGGLANQPAQAADLYLLCLGRALESTGIGVPAHLLPDDPMLQNLAARGFL